MRDYTKESSMVARFTSALFAVIIVSVGVLGVVGCAPQETEEAIDSHLRDELIGTWFAYRDNVIENMWTFRRDGTCTNDGWPNSPALTDRPEPPYHIDGRYQVYSNRVEVYVGGEDGPSDTLTLEEPVISFHRLVYGASNFPVAFLRERTAVGRDYVADEEERPQAPLNTDNLYGSWVAFSGGFPINTWTLKDDGTFTNEGWEPLDPRTILVRRLYQVKGTYEVSGHRVVLSNDKVLRFDPATNQVADVQMVDNQIVLYNVVADDSRLVYTNEQGLPVVFRHGTVSPTNW
jgi:hypothetical protein